jgi:hypothetical protein
MKCCWLALACLSLAMQQVCKLLPIELGNVLSLSFLNDDDYDQPASPILLLIIYLFIP